MCIIWDGKTCQTGRTDQSVTNIFEYSNIRIFLIRIFIRVFVRIIFRIRIYSDIRSCQLFGYEYIRIFVRSKILILIYSNIRSYQFSGHKQIPTMFLFNFSRYNTLLMDILFITMVKNAQPSPECDECNWIFEYLFRYSFVSKFWYEHFRISFRVQNFHINIYRYSFMSYFWRKYIQIFVRIKIHTNVTLWFRPTLNPEELDPKLLC